LASFFVGGEKGGLKVYISKQTSERDFIFIESTFSNFPSLHFSWCTLVATLLFLFLNLLLN
jgi:hypothetical protein